MMSSITTLPGADLQHTQNHREHMDRHELPTELLDRIFHFVDILHVDDQGRPYRQIQETLTLCMLSFVNSTFRIHAQRRLFAYISLRDADYGQKRSMIMDRFTQFLALKQESPYLACFVRSLAIWGSDYRTTEHLAEVLESLPMVKDLWFSPVQPFGFFNTPAVQWSKISTGFKETLYNHTFPRLISLCLGNLRSAPLSVILPSCPELKRLRLESNMTVDYKEVILQHGTPSHPLRLLDLHLCDWDVIAGLAGALERAGCHQMHSLRLFIPCSNCSGLRNLLSSFIASTLTILEIAVDITEDWLENDNFGMHRCFFRDLNH